MIAEDLLDISGEKPNTLLFVGAASMEAGVGEDAVRPARTPDAGFDQDTECE